MPFKRAAQRIVLRLRHRHRFARDGHLLRHFAGLQRHVHPPLGRHRNGHTRHRCLLKTLDLNRHVVHAHRQLRHQVAAIRSRLRDAVHSRLGVVYRHRRAYHRRAARVRHRPQYRSAKCLRPARRRSPQQDHEQCRARYCGAYTPPPKSLHSLLLSSQKSS